MIQNTLFKLFPLNSKALIIRLIFGGLTGLIFIAIFLYPAGEPKPEWGKYWWIKPLVMVPLAGAAGIVVNYVVTQQTYKRRWVKALFIFVSILVFLFALWIGTVLGLNGTYWD